MSIIKVEGVSKRYRLGLKEKQAKTLMELLGNIIKSPYDNFKRLRSLSKFGEQNESVFWALKDINFEVQQGEVLGIIGKNGAGKSTLLKILSQITEPTSGRIEMRGRVASLLEVGTGFHPELSGRENIYMNGTILGMTRREIDSKLDEIIDFSGVEKFIDTPVKFYSSGMKVRLGFSVAAHLDPEILIIDEVLAVGDYEFQKKCLGKMEDVSKNQGRTVLFVSHNMEAVKALCPKALSLNQGKMHLFDKTENVINDYLQRCFIGEHMQEWSYQDAPGNEFVKFKSIVIRKSINNQASFTVHDDLEVLTEFWLEKDDLRINLSLHLYAGTGECLMNIHSQMPPPTLRKGLHFSTCKFPKKLLNSGFYSISMMIVKDTTTALFELKNALSFEIQDIHREDMHWHGKFPGFFRPDLPFTIQV
ncbi:ABC transporter ATP-binding protein [Belliella sp. DSM 111904]|uniref:ABC transporter ATP-binding protein n=1 Tax=Belliella filtrata TaxID=2923435 RepID=A0ABS9UWU5_9BACT|nr:ABC transporter ATP-binding protein [Belliella filtrata]MCH7408641.1 ABC transporter ATP-binding protein [Belliella filtrata]